MRYTLRPYQTKAIDDVRAKIRAGARRLILVAPTGCHAPGQYVMMFDGTTKTVEDICVGDWVMGPDSSPRTVTALAHGHGEMFRIVPVKGAPWIVNADHVLSLVRTNDGWNKANSVFDVSVRDWLAWSHTHKHIHKLFRVGVDFAAGPEPLIDPYFLGILLGDGSIHHNVCVTKPDDEIAEEVRRQATALGMRVRTDNTPGKCPVHHLVKVANSGVWNEMACRLRAIGLYGTRSETKFIPFSYKTDSRERRLELFAGIMDADGSMQSAGYDFISKSQQLSNDVAFVARSLGYAAYVTACEKRAQTGGGGTYYRVSISGDLSEVPCHIPRKRAPKRLQKKDVLRTGFSVWNAGHGEYFGFTLDGDGRYLLDDFTVTHNSGKTICAASIVEGAVAKKSRVLFLAHRLELIDQASTKMDDIGIDHGILKADHWRTDPRKPVQIASIQTLIRREKPRADLVIIDECHRSLAPSIFEIVKEYYPSAVLIGLTATPFRSDGRGLGALYQDMVITAQIKQLVAEGYLIAPRVFAPHRPDLAGVHTLGGDYKQDELASAVDKSKIVGDIVENWKRIANGRRTVAFAASIKHSEHIAEEFKNAGIPSEHVDGMMNETKRRAILGRLASGETLVLSNCDVVSEGFDLTILSCCILARPTKSSAKYLQMVGRIERPSEGKTDALVLDHAGCVFLHGFPTDERNYTLSDTKPAKTGEAPVKVCRECFAVMPSQSTVCPECGSVQETHSAERKPPRQVDGELAEILPGDMRTCRKCGSTETSVFRSPRLGRFTTGIKCRACGKASFVTDHISARSASMDIKREEWERLEAIRERKGYAAGWVSHRFRSLFGCWPRGVKQEVTIES